jgi:organic hydroperoxide reductase OsmC/OhrA
MSEHQATILWHRRRTDDFSSGKYSREHTWSFDGGVTIPASPSPAVVPMPMSNPAFVDPEEAFVASVSSCHMLTYLYLACRAGFQIDSYRDEAAGILTNNEKGIPWISTITLHPLVEYIGDQRPTPDEEARLHHHSHEQCFIANSIKTIVTVGTIQPHP